MVQVNIINIYNKIFLKIIKILKYLVHSSDIKYDNINLNIVNYFLFYLSINIVIINKNYDY